MFFVAGGLCAVGIAVGIPAAYWLGVRLGGILSGMSDEEFESPPPKLSLPAALAARGELNEALALYEAMLVDYPSDAEIYRRMLEISLGPIQLHDYAADIMKRAMIGIKTESDRLMLIRLVEDLKTGRYQPLSHLYSNRRKSIRPGNIEPIINDLK